MSRRPEEFDLCQRRLRRFWKTREAKCAIVSAQLLLQNHIAMWFELGRRIWVMIVIVAFATASVVPVAQAHPQHTQLVTNLSSSVDQGNCDHNGYPASHQSGTQSTCCTAPSNAAVTLPSGLKLYFSIVQEILTPSLTRVVAGLTIPPDPHPPKHTASI